MIRKWLLGGRPSDEIRAEFVQALADGLPHAEVWAPDLELGIFLMRSAESLSRELYGKIDAKIAATPGISQLVSVAYSAGSRLARRVFCMAYCAAEDGTV